MDTVIVLNSQFYSHFPRQIPKGSVNAEQVEIRLDKSWDGLTVFWHWKNLGTGVEKRDLLKDPAAPNDIPWEVLTDLGELRMGLVGLDGETVIKPTIWLTYGYVSDGVDPESGSDPQPPTPSWEQQMVALAEAAANAAKAAKETADNLQAAAEAGEFDGPEGPPGKSPIIKDRTWWIWSVEDQEYKNTGILASGGGGGGVSSYNNLEDRPRIGGVLLEGDKTADDLNLQPKGDYANRTDIPTKLPAPYTLTFSGAVEATYDGSEDVTVTIPTVAGPPGVSPTVSTEEIDGGTRVTFTFQGGSETVDLLNGKDGKTPVKGIDYFTESEIQDVAKRAAALVPGGGGVKPRLIADITIGAGGSSLTTQDIDRIDDINSVCVTISPPEGETLSLSNFFVTFEGESGSVRIGHINAVTVAAGKRFVIAAELFLDFVSCLGYSFSDYMWTTKTVYAAIYDGSWLDANKFKIEGALPEGTRIKVVGK